MVNEQDLLFWKEREKKMSKKITALLLAVLMILSLAACSGKPKSYTVGICQLVQHPALDAATKGFKDALTAKLGDKVTFDEQNASGDTNTCATICNQFVSSKVDLIMANATPALQAAQTSTDKIPILGTSVTDYGTALGINIGRARPQEHIGPPTWRAGPAGRMLKESLQDDKNVGILYCSSEPNSNIRTRSSRYLRLGLYLQVLTFSDSNDLQTVERRRASESDVISCNGHPLPPTRKFQELRVPANVPIIAGEEGICKGCGVATLPSATTPGYATAKCL